MDGFNNILSPNNDPIMFSCLVPPVINVTDIEWTVDGEVIVDEFSNELIVEPETGVYCCRVDGIIVRCAYIFSTSMYHTYLNHVHMLAHMYAFIYACAYYEHVHVCI